MAPANTGSHPTANHLSAAECWEILERTDMGRLALVGEDGVPDIMPVNHLAYEGAIYIRSAHDSKFVRIAAHPVAAYEVDGEDDDTRWSVVVRGAIARVHDEAEIERSGVSRLTTASPRFKPHVLKVTAVTVTGRRFSKDVPANPRTGSLRIAPAPPPAPAEAPTHPGSPPNLIPSRRPYDDAGDPAEG